MSIRHQLYNGPNHWADTCQAMGAYYMLLARVLERWVLDARGCSTDAKAQLREGLQRNALADMATQWPEDICVVKLVAHQSGVEPTRILEGLREQVAA